MSVYKFNVKDMAQNSVSLKEYEGKVLLIINTATECGFTPQYTELQKLYEEYNDQGLEILDFPCNQFGGQAPGSVDEIHEFCSLNYGIKFKQFSKIDVNGENSEPLFEYLKSKTIFKGFDDSKLGKILKDMLSKEDLDYEKKPDIKWNFTKFLVDREGNVIDRFEPTVNMDFVEENIKELI